MFAGRRGRDNHPGQLMVRVRPMADYGWRELTLSYQDQQWSFQLGDLHADLKNGFIHISDPDCQDVAEKVRPIGTVDTARAFWVFTELAGTYV